MAGKGSSGFETFYASHFGDRWPSLREALLAPAKQVARLNLFADKKQIQKRVADRDQKSFSIVNWVEAKEDETPSLDSNNLFDCYLMDLASIFPPLALGAKTDERVLDMCAAPGGKSLIISELLKDGGELVANEISDKRRSRLQRVIGEYVPKSMLSRIRVAGHDAAKWCLHEPNAYDRILLDAPCSGERHLLADSAEIKKWSEARSKNLAVRQYALLASALATVKPGGRIVYSTCALSPRENDAVVARLLKRRAGEARVLEFSERHDPVQPPLGEKTEHGWMILPDTTGFGPIYMAVLERV